MPTYTIETPEGKKLKIEAPDEATALRGAEDWAAGRAKIEQQNEGGWLQTADAFMRGAADAITFGLSDEISAGMGALTGIGGDFGDYSGNLERQRARDRQDEQDYAGTRLTGQLAGGITGGVGLAKNGVTLLRSGQTLPQMIGRGAAEGALYGAAGGFGAGEGGLANRASSAATGAAVGGVMGGAAPVAVAGATRAVRPVVDRYRSFTGPAEKQALERIRIGLRNQGLTDDQIQARMRELGPEAMLADAMGNRGGRLARSAANTSPEARETLQTALDARQAGQNDRVVSAIERASGLPTGNRQTVAQMRNAEYDARMPEISRSYEAAKEAGRDLPIDNFEDLLQSPMARRAWNKSLDAVMDRQAMTPPRANPQAGPLPSAPYDGSRSANRVFRNNAPTAGARPERPVNLSEFVARRGGVQDYKGELAAAGISGMKSGGRNIVTKSGTPLDRMREMAAEAGYLDHLYGSPERAVAQSTVSDFLNTLSDDAAGNPVFSSFDTEAVDRLTQYEAAQSVRRSMRDRLSQLGENMDANLPDEVMLRASDLMDGEAGMDAPDALRHAAYNYFFENGVEPQQLPPGLFDKETVREYSNLARLDATKRILDSQAEVARRSGDRDVAARAGQLAKAFRDRMDALLEDSIYADARRLRQHLFRTEEAIDLGAELAGSRIPLDASARASAVSAQDRQAMARGYGAQQAENLLNRRDMPGALTRLEPNMQREAMRAALGDGAKGVEDQLAREKVFASTRRAVGENSTTAQQLKDMGLGGVGAGLGLLGGLDAAASGGLGLLTFAGKKGLDKAAQRVLANNEEAVAPYIARFLVSNGLPATPQGYVIAANDPKLSRGLSRLVGAMAGIEQRPEASTASRPERQRSTAAR